ncbi:MAG: radical SAM protein [Candidatus Cloacimonetes bacterium]|nr:radical SAM protein [Candidatus Cloacimonadota bacterium]
MKLTISHILYPVYNLGPGTRIALWFQGCSIHCPGCLNPESWDFAGGRQIDLLELYMAILEVAEAHTGISISGGEPFDQYDALVLLCSMLKANTKLDILVFSGYDLPSLKSKHPDLHFMDVIDFLVDGPFLPENMATKGLKGSTNQCVYNIKERREILLDDLEANKICSLQITDDHAAYLSGIPRQGEMDKLIKLLKAQGITWR